MHMGRAAHLPAQGTHTVGGGPGWRLRLRARARVGRRGGGESWGESWGEGDGEEGGEEAGEGGSEGVVRIQLCYASPRPTSTPKTWPSRPRNGAREYRWLASPPASPLAWELAYFRASPLLSTCSGAGALTGQRSEGLRVGVRRVYPQEMGSGPWVGGWV